MEGHLNQQKKTTLLQKVTSWSKKQPHAQE